MPNQPFLEVPSRTANRRAHSRQKLRSVAYIDLGPENGGLILNLSESGLAVSTAMKILDDALPLMTFKLPGWPDAIEARARIVWMSDSKKEAGLRFEQLQERDAQRVAQWIAAEQGLHADLQEAAASSSFLASRQGAAETRAKSASQAAAERGGSLQPPWKIPENAIAPVEIPPIAANWQPVAATADEGSFERYPTKPKPRRFTYAAVVSSIALLSFILGVSLDQRVRHASANRATAKQVKQSPPSAPATTTEAAGISPLSSTKSPSETEVDNARASVEPSNASDTRPSKSPQVLSADRASTAYTAENVQRPRTDTAEKKPRPGAEESAAAAVPDARAAKGESAEPSKTSKSSEEQGVNQSESVNTAGAKSDNRETSPQTQPGNQAAPEPSNATGTTTDANVNTSSPVAVPEAKLPSGTVDVHAPPFPSMRLPADLKSQASNTGQSLQMGRLVSRSQPDYPEEALRERVEGTVKAHVTIGTDGAVQDVGATGPPVLAEAALAAVRQWRYTPTLINGKAVEADEEIIFVFRLSESAH